MKWILFVTLLFGACASGFDRGALRERLAGEPAEVDDEAIREALALSPQLRFPFRMAVKVLAPEPPGYVDWSRHPALEWTGGDREALLAGLAPLVEEGIVSEVAFVSGVYPVAEDLKSLRLAAAEQGADAILVVRGAAQVDRYVNPLAVLNLLIVPMYVVPASHRDALVMIEGGLWDVRNGYLYAGASAEGEGARVAPTAVIETEWAIEDAREAALAAFAGEIVARIRRLRP